jgi:excisionase family DNA binding protein
MKLNMMELISVPKAARQLGIGKDLLYRLCALDEFPHIRIGHRIKIVPAHLTAWVRSNIRGAQCIRDFSETENQRVGFTGTKIP